MNNQLTYSRSINRKLRLKLTDFCNLQCPFCHSEGAAGADDLSVTDTTLVSSLKRLRSHYEYVHFTGGEPTSYRHFNEMVALTQSLGYKRAITSNGLFNVSNLESALRSFEYINISFHTLNPDYFSSFFRAPHRTDRVIDIITENIQTLSKFLSVRINTVVSFSDNLQQLEQVHDFTEQHGLQLKLVPDWRSSAESKLFILDYLDNLGFELSEIVRILPGSNVRKIFRHPTRPKVELKDLAVYRPKFLCESCDIIDSCIESFAFVRLEQNPVNVRLCIYKPSMSSEAFFDIFESSVIPMFDQALSD